MPLSVLGLGARTPNGLGALQTAMGIRARQFEPRASAFVDSHGARVALGGCRAVAEELRGEERLAALAVPAALEALAGGPAAGVPLVIALPDPGRPDAIRGAALLERISAGCSGRVDGARSVAVHAGHAGFAAAVLAGRKLLYEGATEVLVGGVDSHHHQGVIAWLEERGALFTDAEADGRLPSEGAAFLRLGFREDKKRERQRASIVGLELEREAEDDEPGSLLGRLARRVAASTSAGRIEWVLSDLNGEQARAVAWLVTERSAAEAFDEIAHDELVQHTGDLGAATGAVLAAAACVLARTGSVPYGSAVIGLSSDGAERGVVALDLPAAGGAFRASVAEPVHRDVRRSRPKIAATALERAELERRARGCLEDIGSMGLLLSPGVVEVDRDPLPFAQRLLDNLDALASLASPIEGVPSLGDLLARIEAYAGEVSPPDKARRFASAFAAAHLAGASSPRAPARSRL